jgi:hypothetical protein
MATIVFDGDHLQALYDDRGGESIVITFNELDSFANGRNYWAEAPLRAMNVSCVGIMTKRRNWFPANEMISIANILANLTRKFDKIILYGFSQGAYAALKYSDIIRATHVIAFSPQWSIDPDSVCDFDKRFATFFDEQIHTGMEISSSDLVGSIKLIVDPHSAEDYMHAKIIENLLGRNCVVPAFNLGHGTVRAVASTDRIKEIFRIIIDEDKNDKLIFLALKKYKKNTFAYYYTLGRRCLRMSHARSSEALYMRASTINPAHPYLANWAIDLRRAGRLVQSGS